MRLSPFKTGRSVVMASTIHLVVGLGNPGASYSATPHNAGYLVAERMACEGGGRFRKSRRFPARVARATLEGIELRLMQPLTYMNRSGEAVAPWLRYYRLATERMLVIVDDIDRPLGTLRIRPHGSSGGHRGLDSIIAQVGSGDFPRLRIGVGRGTAAGDDVVRHVLTPFSPREQACFQGVIATAAEAARCLLTSGLDPAMNRYNGWKYEGDDPAVE